MTIESTISALQRVGFVAEERNGTITAGTHTTNTKHGLAYNNSFVVIVGIATYQAVIGSTEVLIAKTPKELTDLVKENYVKKGLMK